ncbi:MAG: AAA family ATPase [Deltaproteobacteria bacterium]|nr:AAA family ATPase [Deltaproteobacteria bacterium]
MKRLLAVKDKLLRRFRRVPSRRKLRTRLMLALIPAALLVLALMGHMTYWASSEFIAQALERNSRLHATTTAHGIEAWLETTRQHLLYAAREGLNPKAVAAYFAAARELTGAEYPEFGFIPSGQGNPYTFVTQGPATVRLPDEKISEIRPGPALLYDRLTTLKMGQVWVSDFREIEYPFPSDDNPHARVAVQAFRMATPCGEGDRVDGYLYLAVDAKSIRDILSLYESSSSPVRAFERHPKFIRYSFFLDTDGWILFQSEAIISPETPLGTLQAREAFLGTLGRPDLPVAFRPSSSEELYWRMVEDIRAARPGLLRRTGHNDRSSPFREHSLAYAPVRLRAAPDQHELIIGGVGYEDRSVLVDVAGYKHIDVMLFISAVSVAMLILAIAVVARNTSRGLMDLAEAVEKVKEKGQWEEVRLEASGYEVEVLKNAINSMIGTIEDQMAQIRTKDRVIESVALKEPVHLAADPHDQNHDKIFPEFIGAGPLIHQMKRDIAKAAQVDVDVLVEGETGTGKQLAAEAVHRLSKRANKPFISINCGELDENLLLDTLFGHLKGAFTDGKGDRRGAFQEADGGTLFLDEIQSSSLKVQQALLRALSLRKIRPLGSDKDIDVDVRLITATNTDLKAMIKQGSFREDLYYRLKVVTIQTPALRQHPQNIPVLALHFLREGERMAGRKGMTLSRGAMERLMGHSWPGNIRELRHMIITAAVMSENPVIQADQMGLDPQEEVQKRIVAEEDRFRGEISSEGQDQIETGTNHEEGQKISDLPGDLNPRQLLALRHARRTGEITGKELVDLLEGTISKRTAGYDIQDLVAKGLLVRVGRGPSTRYVPTTAENKG